LAGRTHLLAGTHLTTVVRNCARRYKFRAAKLPTVIVVATADFEVYHEVVAELRERDVRFTTVERGHPLPAEADVVIVAEGESDVAEADDAVTVVEATPAEPRQAVEAAVAAVRSTAGRTVVGIDPGEHPGIAVLSGETVVAAFQVPPERVPAVVEEEIADAVDPLVRVGDGARLVGARIVDSLDVPVELVDESGTTPYLGAGARGAGDLLAAVNIARREGERVESRDVQPTAGELKRIKKRSRAESERNRAIDTDLARRVAVGDLSLSEALDEHRENQ